MQCGLGECETLKGGDIHLACLGPPRMTWSGRALTPQMTAGPLHFRAGLVHETLRGFYQQHVCRKPPLMPLMQLTAAWAHQGLLAELRQQLSL